MKRGVYKRRPIRFSRRIRNDMKQEWANDIFPIALLLWGMPPRTPGPIYDGSGYAAWRDWGAATSTYYSKVRRWYMQNYLAEFTKPKGAIDRHAFQFSADFNNWIAKQKGGSNDG